jgi:acyl carrier protein
MSPDAADQQLLKDLRAVFTEVFKVDAAQIDPKAQLGEWPAWDSMAHMDLMLALESRFGIEISAETISQLISVPAIMDHLKKHQHD